jgi:RNA polymerase sigma factor (sigma-70 family)
MVQGQLSQVLRYLRSAVRGPAARDLTDRLLLERFATQHDQDAFAALVERHGPMVEGVCRRVLGHAQDAEDAFQATFLVLARKAGRMQWQPGVGNWLYEVAYRTAAKARAARKWVRERQVVDLPAREAEPCWQDVRPIVDEELDRLPHKYRAPVVLHYLEGKSYAETARLLGWAEGTVSGRLARAREMLRKRLSRRGLGLPAALLAGALGERLSSAAVPALVIQTTVEAARRFVAGPATAVASTPPVKLAEGVLKAMFMNRLRIAAAVVVALGLLGIGTGLLGRPMRAADPRPDQTSAAQERLARRISRQQPQVGDIASVLHIHKTYCEVELGAPPPGATFVPEFDVYKNGHKVGFRLSGAGIGCPPGTVARQAKLSLQAADLDYLKLGNGPKGNCRLQVDMEIDSTGSGSAIDVPKEIFDFSKVVGSSSFPATLSSAAEVPLFWLAANTTKVTGADTVQGVIDSNRDGDLLIAYLRLAR